MYDNLIFLLFSALSYYIFCGGAVQVGYAVLSPYASHKRSSIWVFLINFSMLSLIAALELNLIFNWLLFFMILLIEFAVLFSTDRAGVLFVTMLCILCGLAANLLIRAALAVIMNVPLASFSPFAVLRLVSAIVGSILTGFFFRWLARSRYVQPMRRILSYRRHLRFLLWTMFVLFILLSLHLLLYFRLDNSILPKLWSLVSCVYIMLGLYWSLCYAARLSYLDHLRQQNSTLQKTLAFRQEQELELTAASNRDALTGLPNRRVGQETILCWLDQQPSFSLCVIDLDGLKQVNDVCGHQQGDEYILTVARLLQHACRRDEDALFRFGGDEFILLFHKMQPESIQKRLDSVCQSLAQASQALPMAISYGIAVRQPDDTLESLIARADQQMYQMKQTHKTVQKQTDKDRA